MANKAQAGDRPLPVGRLSESLEDYLEIILQLQQEKRVARVRDIAARKNVSNASVSNALARLARDGFVVHEAHEFVQLTATGQELARRVLDRHEFLVSFLRDVLQVSEPVAETDACAIEHHVSAETLERLASFYQFVHSCPESGRLLLDAFRICCAFEPDDATPQHQRLCAKLAAQMTREPGTSSSREPDDLVRMTALRPGDAGIVVGHSAAPEVRGRLVDAGLLPNVRVEMRRNSQGAPLQVAVHGCDMDIDSDDASTVVVRRV